MQVFTVRALKNAVNIVQFTHFWAIDKKMIFLLNLTSIKDATATINNIYIDGNIDVEMHMFILRENSLSQTTSFINKCGNKMIWIDIQIAEIKMVTNH